MAFIIYIYIYTYMYPFYILDKVHAKLNNDRLRTLGLKACYVYYKIFNVSKDYNKFKFNYLTSI